MICDHVGRNVGIGGRARLQLGAVPLRETGGRRRTSKGLRRSVRSSTPAAVSLELGTEAGWHGIWKTRDTYHSPPPLREPSLFVLPAAAEAKLDGKEEGMMEMSADCESGLQCANDLATERVERGGGGTSLQFCCGVSRRENCNRQLTKVSGRCGMGVCWRKIEGHAMQRERMVKWRGETNAMLASCGVLGHDEEERDEVRS